MCFWTNLGKLLEKSGWDEALTEAEVFSSGRAQSVVHASHLKRTRFAHEISVVAFTKLKTQAYIESNTTETFIEWNQTRCQQSQTFFFWDLILRIQMWILMFVRAHREQNFELYINTMEKLVGLFFSLDAINYR